MITHTNPKKTMEDFFADWANDAFPFGYGTGEAFTMPALKKILEIFGEKDNYNYQYFEKSFGGLAAWLMIDVLCSKSIFDYGTSPRYGWLSLEGKRLKHFTGSKTAEELYDLCNRDSDYIYCGIDYCNCSKDKGAKCPNPFWRDRVSLLCDEP